VLLPKHLSKAGRVGLYEGYCYLTGFAGPSRRFEVSNGAKEEEASGAWLEMQHHIPMRDQSCPTARGQAKSPRGSKFWPLDGARQQVPSTWRWVRASARDLNIHRRTSCCRQPGPSRGGVKYTVVLVGPVAPSQPSGLLNPTAMESDPSENGVSMETTNRCISSDMSGPLSDRTDGTIANAQEASACLPAGELSVWPIFISGVSDTRSYLPWLRASSLGGLMNN